MYLSYSILTGDVSGSSVKYFRDSPVKTLKFIPYSKEEIGGQISV